MEVIKYEATCAHIYSRSIGEPRPRLCIHCKEPEVCKACHGDGDIHMCGKDFTPTLDERITEFMDGNGITDIVVHTRHKMDGPYNTWLSTALADFHEFMSTRNVKQ